MRLVLGAERAVFAGMGIEAGYREARMGEAEAGFQFRGHDPRRRDDQVARQLRDGVAQRKMDGHGHHGEGRGPQHHHRLRRMAAGRREFGEKFGMAGMPESGAVEHALGNRIGDDRAGPSGDDIADRLADRGDGGVRAGVVGLAGPRRGRMAGGHDRQCVGERSERILGADVGELDLKSESLRPVAEEVAVAEQVECRELQLMRGAATP